MHSDHDSTPGVQASKMGSASDTRLHGHWLLLARVGWLVVALLSVGLFLASIPPYYDQLLTHSASSNLIDPAGVPARLAQLGLSTDFYAAYTTVLLIVMASAFFLVALLIFWRKSDEWMPLIVSLVLMMFGAIFPPTGDAFVTAYPYPALILSGQVLGYVGFTSFFMLFYLFPDGRFVPGWTRWFFVLWIVLSFPTSFFPQSFLDMNTWSPLLTIPLNLSSLGSLMVAQMYRYQRVSNQLQRQQTKWTVLGFSTAILAFVGLASLPHLFFPSLTRSGSLFDLIFFAGLAISFSTVPVSMGFAILKYCLYDIDVLINRALVYGTLTGILALVYVSLVFALQFLLRGLISQTNDIMIVTSTLVIVALFQPLRKHIQGVIDRRFYRRKYDAAKTLAAFSATLRHEVDLDQLSEELVKVVQETMQPAHVSLWLRQPAVQKPLVPQEMDRWG
jgi:hypothetical protein